MRSMERYGMRMTKNIYYHLWRNILQFKKCTLGKEKSQSKFHTHAKQNRSMKSIKVLFQSIILMNLKKKIITITIIELNLSFIIIWRIIFTLGTRKHYFITFWIFTKKKIEMFLSIFHLLFILKMDSKILNTKDLFNTMKKERR